LSRPVQAAVTHLLPVQAGSVSSVATPAAPAPARALLTTVTHPAAVVSAATNVTLAGLTSVLSTVTDAVPVRPGPGLVVARRFGAPRPARALGGHSGTTGIGGEWSPGSPEVTAPPTPTGPDDPASEPSFPRSSRTLGAAPAYSGGAPVACLARTGSETRAAGLSGLVPPDRRPERPTPILPVPGETGPVPASGSGGGSSGGGGQTHTGTGDVTRLILHAPTLWTITPETTPSAHRNTAEEPSFSPD
ncbi:MAG: hypothetical protein JWR24_4080, partial [Actinoallomurus sp.]|nr:hypothetical protein [Actinoallomurus sp.]